MEQLSNPCPAPMALPDKPSVAEAENNVQLTSWVEIILGRGGRVEEMVQSRKCLLGKHEDLSSEPQHPHKNSDIVATYL